MSDEKPVPETLETIAQRIDALTTLFDARFAQVDARFAQVDARFAQVDARFAQVDERFAQVDDRFAQVDVRFSEMRAQLGLKIEAVHDDMKRLYDVVIAMNAYNERHEADHARLEKRLDDHDLRLLALEQKNRG